MPRPAPLTFSTEVLNALPQPLLILDRDLGIRFANRAFADLFLPEGTLLSHPKAVWSCFGETGTEVISALLAEMVRAGASLDSVELDGIRPLQGGRMAFVVTARHVNEGVDADRLTLLAFEDMTGEREAATVAEQNTQAVGRDNIELQRSNEALSQFAQIASHDLQEPLRKIRTYTDMLRETAAGKLDADELSLLDRAASAAARAQRLIGDVLALARVSSQPPVWAVVDLSEITRGVIADLELEIRDRGAAIEVGPLRRLEGDAGQLRQLLQNLIANALKFSRPDTSPVIRLASVPGTLNGADAVVITVADNGIGFDAQYAHSIFEPFQRLHRRGVYEGTGMGLAICKRVTERHGGSIAATGLPGHGSEFTITLPARQSHTGTQ